MKLWGAVIKAIKLLSIFVMAGALYAYAMFQGGYVSWFLFYSVIVIVLFNAVFILYPLRFIEVERRIDRRLLSYNETVKVDLVLKKKIPFPLLFLSVYDEVPYGLRGQGQTSGTVFFFAAAKKLSYTYEVRANRRGEYHFSPIYLQAGDLFGFFQKERTVVLPVTLTVFPRLLPLRRWNTAQRDEQYSTLSVSSKSIEEAFSVAGVREYIPGDKMTSIDWKMSARAAKLVTKEFESQEGKGFLMVLENDKTDHWTEPFERAVEFAVSFIDYCYKQEIPVGFTLSARSEILIEEETKQSHFQQIYKELAKVKKEKISPNTTSAAKRFSGRSIVWISPGLTLQTLDVLQRIASPGKKLVVFYIPNETNNSLEKERLYHLQRQKVNAFAIQLKESSFEVTS
ncbi:DUF58 domain-containing protein [Alteribacillus bidgolensis]|uniref:Uncharacterized conserved protein, DUF58 family, contains vWF domain n=1 Tax=Alteribacillus bidgolensis TaxID=930129 RepID=A0A1G8KAA5_9BACI|nr:DUF58 domain-containing protein [Alteribacillus bidgolensis]SDI40323.1 Uncharacterized conserved protein, DUF58 family, contains vWF domain [Alteribacillus bidgolensis]